MRFVLAILLLVAAPVFAQDIDYSDASTEACLQEALGPSERHACIGASANQCTIKTPGGSATVVVGACFDRELQFWDARLNEVYAQLRAQQADMEPARNANLQAMQRAWITYRDARCDYELVQWGGGTGGIPALIACLMQSTAEQVFVLEQSLR